MPKILNIQGQRFGDLTVVKEANEIHGKYRTWECMCDCGNTKLVTSTNLIRGKTKSCGCLKKVTDRNRFLTHGKKDCRLYSIWCAMKTRCNNQNSQYYYLYGGRGIKVCDRWLHSFVNFYEDMLPTYKDGLSIDRIDVNGSYCKENCRWATNEEQGNNKRTNRILTIDNNTGTMIQLSKIYNKNYGTVKSRLRYGWSVERALKT